MGTYAGMLDLLKEGHHTVYRVYSDPATDLYGHDTYHFTAQTILSKDDLILAVGLSENNGSYEVAEDRAAYQILNTLRLRGTHTRYLNRLFCNRMELQGEPHNYLYQIEQRFQDTMQTLGLPKEIRTELTHPTEDSLTQTVLLINGIEHGPRTSWSTDTTDALRIAMTDVVQHFANRYADFDTIVEEQFPLFHDHDDLQIHTPTTVIDVIATAATLAEHAKYIGFTTITLDGTPRYVSAAFNDGTTTTATMCIAATHARQLQETLEHQHVIIAGFDASVTFNWIEGMSIDLTNAVDIRDGRGILNEHRTHRSYKTMIANIVAQHYDRSEALLHTIRLLPFSFPVARWTEQCQRQAVLDAVACADAAQHLAITVHDIDCANVW